MGNGFWLAVGQMCHLCFWTVRYLPRGDWRKLPRRTLMFGLTIPVLILFQILHWIGFAFDELFFRKYRNISVKQPVFVTGIPRSGTTHLQRVLARHDQLTCMQTWECFLAPSISERYFYEMVGKLVAPLKSLAKLELPFLKKMESIHSLGLNEAEEDFISLMPVNACFLLVVLFPHTSHYWRLSQFDSAMTERKRKQIIQYYHRIIQKHLYFHGEDLRYLCKNPSFITWIQSLSAQYEDASFVVCEREAEKTVPSQLSSLQPTWELIYGNPMDDEFSSKIVGMLAKYYHYLERLPLADVNAMRLPMKELVGDLEGSVRRVLSHCQLNCTVQFSVALQEEVAQAGQYKSAHRYSQEETYNWSGMVALFPATALSAFQKREMPHDAV